MPDSRYKSVSSDGTRHYYHNSSDSGIGSFSDQDSFTAKPDRKFTVEENKQLKDEVQNLKHRNLDLKAELSALKNELTEYKSHVEAVKNQQINALRGENDRLKENNRQLEALATHNGLRFDRAQEDNDIIRRDYETMRREYENLLNSMGQHSRPSSAEMSGALPDDSIKKTKRHSHRSDKDKHRSSDDDKERLSRRFSTKPPNASETRRSRRESKAVEEPYLEPFGSGGRPRRASSVSASTRVKFPPIATSDFQEPKYSAVPRVIQRPSRRDSMYGKYSPREDGSYIGDQIPIRTRMI